MHVKNKEITKALHYWLFMSRWSVDSMMTSSNENIFRVTGPLCEEFTVPMNSLHKGQWCGALMFSLICAWINDWVNSRDAGDFRRHCAHYDVNVMPPEWTKTSGTVSNGMTSPCTLTNWTSASLWHRIMASRIILMLPPKLITSLAVTAEKSQNYKVTALILTDQTSFHNRHWRQQNLSWRQLDLDNTWYAVIIFCQLSLSCITKTLTVSLSEIRMGYVSVMDAHHWSPISLPSPHPSLIPHLIGPPSLGPPSHYPPVSTHAPTIPLVPYLIGPPTHWSPISLVPHLIGPHLIGPRIHNSPTTLFELIGPPILSGIRVFTNIRQYILKRYQ